MRAAVQSGAIQELANLAPGITPVLSDLAEFIDPVTETFDASHAGMCLGPERAKPVVDWAEQALTSTQPGLLVLAGPRGCGKTHLLRYAVEGYGWTLTSLDISRMCEQALESKKQVGEAAKKARSAARKSLSTKTTTTHETKEEGDGKGYKQEREAESDDIAETTWSHLGWTPRVQSLVAEMIVQRLCPIMLPDQPLRTEILHEPSAELVPPAVWCMVSRILLSERMPHLPLVLELTTGGTAVATASASTRFRTRSSQESLIDRWIRDLTFATSVRLISIERPLPELAAAIHAHLGRHVPNSLLSECVLFRGPDLGAMEKQIGFARIPYDIVRNKNVAILAAKEEALQHQRIPMQRKRLEAIAKRALHTDQISDLRPLSLHPECPLSRAIALYILAREVVDKESRSERAQEVNRSCWSPLRFLSDYVRFGNRYSDHTAEPPSVGAMDSAMVRRGIRKLFGCGLEASPLAVTVRAFLPIEPTAADLALARMMKPDSSYPWYEYCKRGSDVRFFPKRVLPGSLPPHADLVSALRAHSRGCKRCEEAAKRMYVAETEESEIEIDLVSGEAVEKKKDANTSTSARKTPPLGMLCPAARVWCLPSKKQCARLVHLLSYAPYRMNPVDVIEERAFVHRRLARVPETSHHDKKQTSGGVSSSSSSSSSSGGSSRGSSSSGGSSSGGSSSGGSSSGSSSSGGSSSGVSSSGGSSSGGSSSGSSNATIVTTKIAKTFQSWQSRPKTTPTAVSWKDDVVALEHITELTSAMDTSDREMRDTMAEYESTAHALYTKLHARTWSFADNKTRTNRLFLRRK
jgi:hypothetical protein